MSRTDDSQRTAEESPTAGKHDASERRNRAKHRSIHRAQKVLRQYVPDDRSLADELIAERHAEAEHE